MRSQRIGYFECTGVNCITRRTSIRLKHDSCQDVANTINPLVGDDGIAAVTWPLSTGSDVDIIPRLDDCLVHEPLVVLERILLLHCSRNSSSEDASQKAGEIERICSLELQIPTCCHEALRHHLPPKYGTTSLVHPSITATTIKKPASTAFTNAHNLTRASAQ